jgi:hypothetical protein
MSNVMISPRRIRRPSLPRMHRPSPSKHASIKGIPWLSSGVTRLLLANLLVAACIYAAGVLTALLLKGKNPSLTLIWPAGGIALAAVILRGPWVAPGIFMPLWISCLVGGEGHLFAILAPLGTTLAIVAGAFLLQRTRWNRKLSTSRDVLLLLGLGGLLPMMVAGFWTSLLLVISKAMPGGAFLPVGWLYGCANAAGTIVVAPVILLAAAGRFRWRNGQGMLHSILPISCCVLATLLAFGISSGNSPDDNASASRTLSVLAYLPFPFLVWTALTRGLPAAAAAILAIVAIAVTYTSHGMGPFASVSLLNGIWQYEVYIAILTSTGLLLGAGSEAQRRERSLREQALVREAELERIKAQIHPHFLFNSLNAIHSLIGSDPGGARGGILSLSRLLRTSLDTAREPRIPLAKEMEIIRSYLELQKMRFEEGLETEISVHGEALEFPVAPMTIQPLVENAVKHGSDEGTASVSITATASGDWLAVTISNLATPGTDPSTWKDGVGLASVRTRLRETWGDRAELYFAATPSGKVTTSLKVPRT